MKIIKYYPLSLLLTFLAPDNCLRAQTLSLSPTSVDGSIVHQYDNFFGAIGTDYESLLFGTPSVQLAGYNTIQVSVSAPAGEAWNVAYAGQGFNSANLRFELLYNNGFGAPFASINSADWQFDFVNGSTSSLGALFNGSFIPDGGDRLDFDLEYTVVDDFSFTGFTTTITFDNSSITPADLSGFDFSELSYTFEPNDSEAPDPGQQLTLQPAPEPSSLSLIGLGALGAFKFYRRRQG